MSSPDLGLVAGVLSVVSDVIAVLLPCLMLHHYNLDISRKQKIFLNATFCLGLVATGAGIARTVYMWKIHYVADQTWTGHTLFAWSIVETELAIICACAPSLRAFFRRYLLDTIMRTCSSGGVSHYANGGGEGGGSQKGSFHSMAYAPMDMHRRGFSELEQLESGLRGIQFPPLVMMKESNRTSCISQSSGPMLCAFNQTKKLPPSPKCTTPDEYESYVNNRLSRHGTAILGRQSRTESILIRMDHWVDQSSICGQSHDRSHNADDDDDDDDYDDDVGSRRDVEKMVRTAS